MNQNTPTQPVNRLYKSKIFAMLYSNKKELLELYNAISGRHYEDPELLVDQHSGECNLYVHA